ncbi:LOW QUALITY PROTEIN: Hypothetical protein PHPALM_16979 [Phytophthora palmivora]|uniref:Uncharacterized protein n=1 Tax=Phytophthora palmivora TaxID=4796 RepID=A0A2P4XND4_9STRA|nr:LOW QUALITY PROTEIN: Hypothetical protein PHPALM_16979 [Phytophthora palmivora]
MESVDQCGKEFLGSPSLKRWIGGEPKDLKALKDLAFPGSLRSILRNLRGCIVCTEGGFAAISKDDAWIQIERSMKSTKWDQLDLKEDRGSDLTLKSTETFDPEE